MDLKLVIFQQTLEESSPKLKCKERLKEGKKEVKGKEERSKEGKAKS